MRLKTYHLALIAVLCLLASCDLLLPKATPKTVAQDAMKCLVDKDYDAYAEYVDIKTDSLDSSKIKQKRTEAANAVRSFVAPEYDKKGGLKKVDILNEKILPGDTTAKVKMKLTFGDGSTSENTKELVKRGDTWKLKDAK